MAAPVARALVRVCTACGRPVAPTQPRPPVAGRQPKGFPIRCFVCNRRGWLPIPLSASVRPEHIICPKCQTRWPRPVLFPVRRAQRATRKAPNPSASTLLEPGLAEQAVIAALGVVPRRRRPGMPAAA